MSGTPRLTPMGEHEREAFVTTLLASYGIVLNASDWHEVAENTRILQEHAAIVMRRPIAEDVEIAPVFTA